MQSGMNEFEWFSNRQKLESWWWPITSLNSDSMLRVRPVSQKETKANDDSIIQFPGEGQIWVRMIIRSIIVFYQTMIIRYISLFSSNNVQRWTKPKETWNRSPSTSFLNRRRPKRTCWSTVAWRGIYSQFTSLAKYVKRDQILWNANHKVQFL